MTPLSQVMTPNSLTTTTSQRPLKSSSRSPPATAGPRTCMTRRSMTTPSAERSLHHCSLRSEMPKLCLFLAVSRTSTGDGCLFFLAIPSTSKKQKQKSRLPMRWFGWLASLGDSSVMLWRVLLFSGCWFCCVCRVFSCVFVRGVLVGCALPSVVVLVFVRCWCLVVLCHQESVLLGVNLAQRPQIYVRFSTVDRRDCLRRQILFLCFFKPVVPFSMSWGWSPVYAWWCWCCEFLAGECHDNRVSVRFASLGSVSHQLIHWLLW